jgi:hypothetical protein
MNTNINKKISESNLMEVEDSLDNNNNLEGNSKYSNLSVLLNYSKNNLEEGSQSKIVPSQNSKIKNLSSQPDYLKDLLEKVQKISLYFKKFKLVEDPKYLESRNKEYSQTLRETKRKIENLILKTILYAKGEKRSGDLNHESVKE